MCVGSRRVLDVMDVNTQKNIEMTMKVNESATCTNKLDAAYSTFTQHHRIHLQITERFGLFTQT